MVHERATILTQAGNRTDPGTGAVSTPVYFSTSYAHPGLGESTGFDYTRTANPTRSVLEETLRELEKGDGAFACSSGMAAIHTVFGLFRSGEEVIVSRDLYGGTYRLFEEVLTRYGITFRYADLTDAAALESEMSERTKAVFFETPANPLMKEVNISKCAAVCKKHGIRLIVDNTFYTPLLQNPLEEGADIVIHSGTKYLGGHNDVLAGAIITKGEELTRIVRHLHNGIGATLSAMDSWLLLRGMKTLHLRMKQHEENAETIAEFLEGRDEVREVLYPGRGGMLSFRLTGEEQVPSFLEALNIITFAESLGGVESFITYPATQTHADIPEETRVEYGVDGCLLRFSVGIEDKNDLVDDLGAALLQSVRKST
ncbi:MULTISPECIES: aminotransferase class I/II-fold pyridoxal phosphate-dependent enzyme [Salimicrobium]|uniref:Cystathionine gamma-synthase n=1 Tax=Salimicrobium humidisoli TaxID=2029857 RepID=A0ABX4HN47_9BACI|nr:MULTISPECIES: aminotransferase class I/II-fold pyridoxal phosphate-dependent enzyme [Salimicrobium]PBB04611.1 cystathionine gamma-synthase [Salimicrobium humidisoli]